MSDGFWGVVFVMGLFLVPFGWSYLSERSKPAAMVGEATESAVDGGRWIIMKVVGVLMGAGSISLFAAGPNGFKDVAIMVLAFAYGAYLLFPGRPDEKSLWFW